MPPSRRFLLPGRTRWHPPSRYGPFGSLFDLENLPIVPQHAVPDPRCTAASPATRRHFALRSAWVATAQEAKRARRRETFSEAQRMPDGVQIDCVDIELALDRFLTKGHRRDSRISRAWMQANWEAGR